MKRNPHTNRTHDASELALGRHNTMFRLRRFFAASSKAPKTPLQMRWERRWTAASGAWFAVLLAVLFGGTNWRVAVMLAATTFMLARGGDMLDHGDE